ncbi:MAG: FecR family protein [Prolixibacteraceae bacterium]|jgi:ferric-dicitrate binding protein FerR (iron transport regulator)|nr:FecR family protein [Prolixibacteraceae bacterium]
MATNQKYNQELIASAFHDGHGAPDNIPPELKETQEYKATEKIFSVREKVSFLNSLSSEDQFWNKIRRQVQPQPVYFLWLKYAAIVVLSLSIGILLSYFSGLMGPDGQLATINSPRGQITSLTLFDGTTVWLNSETTIRYSSGFNKKQREVFIEGEAYFEVSHNDKLPFVVNLKNSKVKVHGTTFNVKAYPSDNFIETVLEEGNVEFIANNQSVFLKPNEKITFSSEENILKREQTNAEIASAWKKGKYYYSGEKLAAIIQQMQRWYDTEFIFNENELSELTFTGVINREKSIEYNLKIIELTNKIKFESKNDAILISGKK